MARKLGEILVQEGLINPSQLEAALVAQRQEGGALGSHLMALGFLTEEELAPALAKVYGVPAVLTPDLLAAPPEVVALLSADYSRRHRAFPFRIEGRFLHLALQNPADLLAVDEAAFLTGFAIRRTVATEAAILTALAEHHHLPAPGAKAIPDTALAQRAVSRPRDTALSKKRTLDLQSIGEQLIAAPDRETVLRLAAESLAFVLGGRGMVFVIRGDEVALARAHGIQIPEGRQVVVPVHETTILSPALEGRVAVGTVQPTAANRDLYTLLDGKMPYSALVAPVVARGRIVAVLYADDPEGSAEFPDLDQVQKLTSMLACAIEIVLLKRKIRREGGAGGS